MHIDDSCGRKNEELFSKIIMKKYKLQSGDATLMSKTLLRFNSFSSDNASFKRNYLILLSKYASFRFLYFMSI